MKFGLPISIVCHAVMFAGGYIAFSNTEALSEEGQLVPVEVLTVAEFTNIQASLKGERRVETDEMMRVTRALENAPEVGDPSRRTTDSNPLPATNDDAGDASVPERSNPVPEFDIDKIAELVDKTRDTQIEADMQRALESEEAFYNLSDNSRAISGLGTELTVSELDALQSAMYECWRIPLDAENPEELVVRVRVKLTRGGDVEQVSLIDQGAINRSRNPYMKVAARRALSAVSKCAPYDFLPQEKYDRWQDMNLRFKPEL